MDKPLARAEIPSQVYARNANSNVPLCNYCQARLLSRLIDHFGNGILFPNAKATQPPIKHSPPSGVTGPKTLNLCGSRTRRYMLPLNIVMPATNNPDASVFFGATVLARRRTPECSICGKAISICAREGREKGIPDNALLCSSWQSSPDQRSASSAHEHRMHQGRQT
jgi:hypothetical protein